MDTMDIGRWAVSTGVGALLGALIGCWYLLYHADKRRRNANKVPGADACKYLHEVAASEKTVYGNVVSGSAQQHIVFCRYWAIVQGPERWTVVPASMVMEPVQYLCEHDWLDSPDGCKKCGVSMADAYRPPTIVQGPFGSAAHSEGTHKHKAS